MIDGIFLIYGVLGSGVCVCSPGDTCLNASSRWSTVKRTVRKLALDLGFRGLGIYLEGQGDLISRLIMGIIRVTIWVIGVINLLTKSP